MTPAALADVVTNARAKVAAGNADYLDVAVVALADGNARLSDVIGGSAKVLATDRADLDAAVALLRRWLCQVGGDMVGTDTESFLASHPAPAKEGT